MPAINDEDIAQRNDDELLTTEQLAAEWNVPPSRLNKERLVGGGCPYIKLGHLVRYRRKDARLYVESRLIGSTSEQAA